MTGTYIEDAVKGGVTVYEQNEEIKDLHKKVAELQAQLYQEQEKNKGFTR